jgi:hypothetical protein
VMLLHMTQAEWSIASIQAVATIVAAVSAWAAWRAADTSRAIAEDQRRIGRLARLEEVHEALLNVETILNRKPVPALELEAAGRTVRRHVALLPKRLAEDQQLSELKLWLFEPEVLETEGGRMVAPDYAQLIQEPLGNALRYVEMRLESYQVIDAK